MGDAIHIQQIPGGDTAQTAVSSARVIELPMTAHDRRRVRRIVEAPDGARLALDLATGTVLVPGQVLHRHGDLVYVVTAAAEEVIVAHPRSLDEAARVGHLIGNLHRDLEAADGAVIALADAALADRLRRAGVPFNVELRAFLGRAPGDHAH